MTSSSPRHASWLELFYDLVFVALVAQFTYAIANQTWTPLTVLVMVVVGYMIFQAWWGTTVSRNLQESETLPDRVLIQIQMVLAFVMSLYLPDVFIEADWVRFVGAYAALRSLQIFLILRMYRLRPELAPQTYNVVQGLGISVGLWLIVPLVALPFGYVVAVCALLIEMLTPLTEGEGNRPRLLNVEHMQERLGLFLLLVMGESVLVVALSNTAVATDLARPFTVIMGLLYMIGVWWLYFSHLEAEAEGKRPRSLFWYLQAHGWLYGSVVVVAAGFKNILSHGEFMVADAMLLVIGGLSMSASLYLIRVMTHGRNVRRLQSFFLKTAAFLGVFVVAYQLDSVLLLVTGLALVVLLVATLDEWRRVKAGVLRV